MRIFAVRGYSSGTTRNRARQPRRSSSGSKGSSSRRKKARSSLAEPLLVLLTPAVLIRDAPSHDAATFGEGDEQSPLVVRLDRILATVRHSHLREVQDIGGASDLNVNLVLVEEPDRDVLPPGARRGGKSCFGTRRRGSSSRLPRKSLRISSADRCSCHVPVAPMVSISSRNSRHARWPRRYSIVSARSTSRAGTNRMNR